MQEAIVRESSSAPSWLLSNKETDTERQIAMAGTYVERRILQGWGYRGQRHVANPIQIGAERH